MGWKEINLQKYTADVKKNMNLDISEEIIAKDLLLTLILAEFQKENEIFNDLIFKGGTLLSRNYLGYHRFSEDLDFVHRDSANIRRFARSERERRIKSFIDLFVPKLKKVADTLSLNFSTNRSDTNYCSILHGRTVYIFRVYYESNKYIKIEINFVEKLIYPTKRILIKAITDFFDSKELLFILNLNIYNFKIMSYHINEMVLEKYRALLTRNSLMERDLFDLYLIPNSLKVKLGEVVEKIECSSLIKKDLEGVISKKFELLKNNEFFDGQEKISDLAIVKYNLEDFNKFKAKIQPILIKICEIFLER